MTKETNEQQYGCNKGYIATRRYRARGQVYNTNAPPKMLTRWAELLLNAADAKGIEVHSGVQDRSSASSSVKEEANIEAPVTRPVGQVCLDRSSRSTTTTSSEAAAAAVGVEATTGSLHDALMVCEECRVGSDTREKLSILGIDLAEDLISDASKGSKHPRPMANDVKGSA